MTAKEKIEQLTKENKTLIEELDQVQEETSNIQNTIKNISSQSNVVEDNNKE